MSTKNGDKTPKRPASAVSALSALRSRVAQTSKTTVTSEKKSLPTGNNATAKIETVSSSTSVTTIQHTSTTLPSSHSQTTSTSPSPSPRRSASREYEDDHGDHLPVASSTTKTKTTTSPLIFSTFRASPYNYITRQNATIELRFSNLQRVVIFGNYGIQVLEGAVTVYGATLTAPKNISASIPTPIVWVSAPTSRAIPIIRSVEENTTLRIHSDSRLRSLAQVSPAFHILWPIHDTKRQAVREDEFVGTTRTALRPTRTRIFPPEPAPDQTFRIVFGEEDLPARRDLIPLSTPPEWHLKITQIVEAISESQNNTRRHRLVFVCGPNSSGKSTFARLLANRLLTTSQNTPLSSLRSIGHKRALHYLDLNPESPDFLPPGMLSLVRLAGAHTSPPLVEPWLRNDGHAQLLRCHALGHTSLGSDPEIYLQLVRNLFHESRHAVTIVSTPGWILGTGLDVLLEMIKLMNPTDVVYMSRHGPVEATSAMKSIISTSTWSSLPSRTTHSSPVPTSSIQSLTMESYFHYQITSTPPFSIPNETSRWDPQPMASIPPWRVSYHGPDRGIFAIVSYGDQPGPSVLVDSINGMILAAVYVSDARAFQNLAVWGAPKQKRKRNQQQHSISQGADEKGNGSMQETATTLAEQNFYADGDGAINFSKVVIDTTPEGIPYLPNEWSLGLDPKHHRTLGYVLVRGVDVAQQELHILTPIPEEELARVGGDDGGVLVLVHGEFEPPHWAYMEDMQGRSRYEGEVAKDSYQSKLGEDVEDEDEDGEDEVEGHGNESSEDSDIEFNLETPDTMDYPPAHADSNSGSEAESSDIDEGGDAAEDDVLHLAKPHSSPALSRSGSQTAHRRDLRPWVAYYPPNTALPRGFQGWRVRHDLGTKRV